MTDKTRNIVVCALIAAFIWLKNRNDKRNDVALEGSRAALERIAMVVEKM
jgi:hypothetical protein